MRQIDSNTRQSKDLLQWMALDIFREGALWAREQQHPRSCSFIFRKYLWNGRNTGVFMRRLLQILYGILQEEVFVGQMRTRLGIPGYENHRSQGNGNELLKIIGVTESWSYVTAIYFRVQPPAKGVSGSVLKRGYFFHHPIYNIEDIFSTGLEK